MRIVLHNQIYRHYKGKLYKIITFARSTDNPSEIHVIYQAQYTEPKYGQNCIWSRKLHEFNDDVIINGIKQRRFTLQK